MRARPPRLAAGIAPPVHAGGRLLHHGIGHQAARSLATFRIRGSARWRCRCQRRRATPAPADRPAAVARHRHSEHRSQTSERSPLPATRSRRPPDFSTRVRCLPPPTRPLPAASCPTLCRRVVTHGADILGVIPANEEQRVARRRGDARRDVQGCRRRVWAGV